MDPTQLRPFDLSAVTRLNAGEERPPSEYEIALDPDVDPPSAYGLIERAREIGLELQEVEAGENELLRLSGGPVEITVRPVQLQLRNGASTRRGPLPDDELEALRRTRHEACLRMTLGEPVLEQFHLAQVTAEHLFPDLLAAWDTAQFQWLTAEQIQAAAGSHTPPPPEDLYMIHSVGSDDKAWLHTHGLGRCGAIELELFAPSSTGDLNDLASLLRAAACQFIDRGTPPAGEPFPVGRDLNLVWIPWDRALQVNATEPSELGGIEDRPGHDGLVGTLFAYREDALGAPGYPGLAPVSDLLPILRDNPLFFLSTMETRRMAALATEHFPTFRRLLVRAGHREGWSFRVKLGYATDSDGEGSEHLWFEAHGFENGQIDATLQNEPYDIARLHEGLRGLHAVDELSDWKVEVEGNVYGPDRVTELLALEDSER